MDEREAYARLVALLQQTPSTVASNDTISRWLGQAYAIVNEVGQSTEATKLNVITSTKEISGNAASLRDSIAVVHRVLGVIELRLPAETQAGFIGVGNTLDGLAAVSKAFDGARTSIRVVDPYMDEKVVTNFAVLAPPGISLQLLTDPRNIRPSLKPAVGAYQQQYGASRPIEARLSSPGALHDRLIIVDGSVAYNVSQSFKDLAARSPASIIRFDAETGALKVAAYDSIWTSGTALA